MDFLKIIETLLNKKYPSLEKDNIALIIAITGLAVSIVIMGFNYFIKYIKYDLFDLKLLHKKNQTFIPFIRNLILVGLLTIIFFFLSLYITFIIINFPILERCLVYIMLVLFSLIAILPFLFLIDPIIFLFMQIFKRNNPRFIIAPYLKSKINKYPSFFYNLSIIFITLIITTEMVVVQSSKKKNENIFEAIQISDCVFILMFCLFPSLILFLNSYHKKNKYFYRLIDVTVELPKYNLSLDYFINDTTSVLTSEDNIIKVIKKSGGENLIFEVYEKVEKKNNETNKKKTHRRV